MRVATLVPVVSLVGGVAAGLSVPDHARLGAAAVALLWIGLSTTLAGARGGWMRACVGGVVLAFTGGGALLGATASREAWRPTLRQAFEGVVGSQDEGLQAVVTGVLRADATAGSEAVVLHLDVTTIEVLARGSARHSQWVDDRMPRSVHGGVRASVNGGWATADAAGWRSGRTVKMPIWLRRPTTYRNPGALDEERALARRGVTLVGAVKSAALVEVVRRGSRSAEAAADARAWIRRTVAAHVGRWSSTSAAIVTAILIGDRAGLQADVQARLQDAGTYHVLAISGGNIAILAVVALALFRWTGTLGRVAMLAAIVTFLTYAYIVDGGPSVSRAITVAVLAFAARLIDQRIDPRHGLLVAAGLLVAGDPLALQDPGFLLSFGATLGIVLTMALLSGRSRSFAGGVVVSMLVASLAAELALLPIVTFFFGRITVAGLALNFAAIPLMAVAQISGLALLAIAPMSWLAGDVVGWVAAMAAEALVASASAVEWVPAVAWRVSRPSAAALVAYYVALALALAAWRMPVVPARLVRSVRWGTLIVACGAVMWIAAEPWTWTMWANRREGRLRVTFLDVGQGDATLVRFPRGAAMLIDAGGSPSEAFDIGDRVVTPALRYLGIRRLSTLALSHGDGDHVGGAASIAHTFRPFDIWEGIPVPRSPLLQAIRAVADANGTRWTTIRRGDETVIDGVRILAHHPPRPDWERQDARNDDSIVLELRWQDVSIVLPGDIGRAVEAEIGAALEPAPLRVLKAAHHGSASSSSEAWLHRVRPTIAIVSAGRYNPFGHPAPAVLARYQDIGAAVYRTDRDGAITVDTDGSSVSVHTMTGRSAFHAASAPAQGSYSTRVERRHRPVAS